ncbi:hypothetical protein D8B26_003398 [Coccidioides posadasii str. Silveira]|nr:hypothetical protein D8B26_003398 [Coccidioides posadasii str. Silveira]
MPILITQALDLVARTITSILEAGGHRHGFIGVYAVTLLGGNRETNDADLIVDTLPAMIQTELLREDGRFQLKGSNKLIFVLGEYSGIEPINVKILQGGADQQTDVIHIAPSAVQAVRTSSKIPILHPSALLLTKVRDGCSMFNPSVP